MTGEAIGSGIGIPGGVAAQARLAGVRAGQREISLIVVKGRRGPGRG